MASAAIKYVHQTAATTFALLFCLLLLLYANIDPQLVDKVGWLVGTVLMFGLPCWLQDIVKFLAD